MKRYREGLHGIDFGFTFRRVQLAKLGRVIGSSLVESFTKGYTLTDPNGTEEKYT
jgi:hypothetical protein